jgi:NAD(P)-dependent dehydrogenase (short-subunit alcohol dehydrogenase family)
VSCDITDTEALKAAIAAAAAENGPVTVLVNNASDDTRHATLDLTEAEWDATQAVNLRPYFFAAQAVIPGMQAAGGGAIVNFSSITYLIGSVGMPGYVAANAAIVGLTRTLAREFGPSGIRVNALAPGMVITDRQLRLWLTEESIAAHTMRQCLPIRLTPAEMVDPALFLASDASRGMTGQCLAIDGGVVITG